MSIDSRKMVAMSMRENTTIAIVATDATLTKAECHRVAVAAHDGIGRATVPAHTPHDGDLVFANFVEFDSIYGHRRDISGYARALEWFDTQVPRILDKMREGDLVLFTADHGNDPSWVGTDHTRERVPVVAAGFGAGEIGMVGFSDSGASVAAHLGLDTRGAGRSFL